VKIVVLHVMFCHGSSGTPNVTMVGNWQQKARFPAGVSLGRE